MHALKIQDLEIHGLSDLGSLNYNLMLNLGLDVGFDLGLRCWLLLGLLLGLGLALVLGLLHSLGIGINSRHLKEPQSENILSSKNALYFKEPASEIS